MLPTTAIGGWLLIYLVWAALGICFGIYANGSDLLYYMNNEPLMETAGIIIFILVAVYNLVYVWFLIALCRKRTGIIAKIKWMILITPVFNACLPAIFAIVLSFSLAGLPLGELVKSAYPAPVVGSLCGAAVMALVWHRYFTVSRRVAAIWPNG